MSSLALSRFRSPPRRADDFSLVITGEGAQDIVSAGKRAIQRRARNELQVIVDRTTKDSCGQACRASPIRILPGDIGEVREHARERCLGFIFMEVVSDW